MMSHIVRASAEIHGTYNNGNGGDVLRPFVHEVVAKRPALQETGEQESIPEFVIRLSTTASAMREPTEDMEKLIRKQYGNETEFEGRWGYRGHELIAVHVLEAAGLSDLYVARLVRSEFDPSWIMEADAENIKDHASAIIGARSIASHFHSLDLWAFNSG